jgi:hypothetical protein
MRAVLLLPMLIACTSAETNTMMFPVPPGAESPSHIALSPGVGEQDYFWLNAPFPETPALPHYSQIFSDWVECKPWRPGWDGYGDASNEAKRYVHRFARHWISKANDHAITLLFQYESPGLDFRQRPDNDKQFVAVIKYKVPDAGAFFSEVKIACAKAPNSTVERDARKSGARPSP